MSESAASRCLMKIFHLMVDDIDDISLFSPMSQESCEVKTSFAHKQQTGI